MEKNILIRTLEVLMILFSFGQCCFANAVCTNCSDCTNKINSAPAGSIVYLLPSHLTSSISSNATCINIHNKSGVSFDCQGYAIIGSGPATDYSGIILINSTGSTIKNCAIRNFHYAIYSEHSDDADYIGNTIEGVCTAAWIEHSNRIEITGSTIKNCICEGVTLSYCNDSVFSGNEIINSSNAFALVQGNSDQITQNIIDKNEVIGMNILLSSNNVISGNRISNTSDPDSDYINPGIEIGGSCEGNQIINNTIERNEMGISFNESSGNVINHNLACYNTILDLSGSPDNGAGNENTCDKPDGWNDAGTSGCTYSCSGATTSTSTTTSTTSTTTLSDGLHCNSCEECNEMLSGAGPDSTVYLDSNITDSNQTCILITEKEGVNFNCQGNHISGTFNGEGDSEPKGIYINQSISISIKNCTIRRFKEGIACIKSNNTIISNNILESVCTGIDVRGADGNRIWDNEALNDDCAGIVLSDSAGNNLSQNRVINSSFGIFVQNSFGNTIINNQVENNGDGGIWISGDSNYNNLSYNIAWGNVCGILIENSANNSIDSNTIYNNTNGINVSSFKLPGEDYTDSIDNVLQGNRVCSNRVLDYTLLLASNNSGDENVCDKPDGWNDAGTTGCSYSCNGTVTTSSTLPTSTSTSTTTSSSTTSTTTADCALPGDYPPCDEISIQEIIDMINKWIAGTASLGEVIDLINAWASRP
jgi:parallel beta-helix repeat protein